MIQLALGAGTKTGGGAGLVALIALVLICMGGKSGRGR
jgi:hypothetical protein